MTKYEEKTKEPQYSIALDYVRERGVERMGIMTSQAWYDDPKRLAFTLSRYKFVAKMLSGRKNVLEVGCADAFGSRIVAQEVANVTVSDFDPVFIKDVEDRMSPRWRFDCLVHDMLSGPIPKIFDAVYALDVLEHIEQKDEDKFISNIVSSLDQHGVVIFGMPSLESQDYASPISKEGHVNCKSMPDLKLLVEKYFYNVFTFSMNDEVLHTGFHKMAHYIFAIGCGKRSS